MGNRTDSIKIIAIALLLFVSITSSGCLRSFEEESRLHITDMDISAEEIKSAFVDINVTTHIENSGGDTTGNLTLVLRAYNTQTGLLEMEKEQDVDTIYERKTASVTQPMELPKEGGYRIVAQLFEDDSRRSRGEITLRNLEGLPADIKDTGIEITEMDFLVREVNGNKVVIQNDIYLTNEGAKTSSDYRMLVKAREIDARLVADKEWIETGRFEPETTVIRSVNLSVPDNYNYVVEVLVWDNDTIIKRGEGIVQLNPTMEIDKDTQIQTKRIETGGFVVTDEEVTDREFAYPEEEEEEAAPGFGILLAMASIFSMAVLMRRRTR